MAPRTNTSAKDPFGGKVVVARRPNGNRSRVERIRLKDPATGRLSLMFRCLDCPQGEVWTSVDDAKHHRLLLHKGSWQRRAEEQPAKAAVELSQRHTRAVEPDPSPQRRSRQPRLGTARINEDVLSMPLREVLELAAQIELLAKALHETERARDQARQDAVQARRELRQFKTGLKRLGFTEQGITGDA